jgi:hypothetical protein
MYGKNIKLSQDFTHHQTDVQSGLCLPVREPLLVQGEGAYITGRGPSKIRDRVKTTITRFPDRYALAP